MARRPEGLILPDRIPARGFPPRMPGCHICTMAPQRGSRRHSSSGRPLDRTKTSGFPVWASSAASCSWISGSAIVEREAFSPLHCFFSPRQRTTTSAAAAAATASRNPERSSPSKSQPRA